MSSPTSNTDSLLEMARRLDWRFLLSDPQLNRVAYFGKPDSALFASLKVLSKEAICLPDSTTAQKFDLLVMENPSTDSFRDSLLFLQPKGVFYIEFAPDLKRALWLNTMKSEARKQGFSHLRFHWHWSNFESSDRIIPLATATPLLFDLAKKKNSLRMRIMQIVARVMIYTGIAPYLLPSLSMIGERK